MPLLLCGGSNPKTFQPNITGGTGFEKPKNIHPKTEFTSYCHQQVLLSLEHEQLEELSAGPHLKLGNKLSHVLDSKLQSSELEGQPVNSVLARPSSLTARCVHV